MPKFRKKPVVIEAMLLDPDDLSIATVSGWMLAHGCDNFKVTGDTRAFGIAIPTLEGVMQADPGDWVIRGVQGEFYPCKSDVFEATYERVADDERTDSVSGVRGGPAASTMARTTPRRLVSTSEAATYIGCHPLTIRRRIADGTLTGYRMGPRMLRVDLDELDAALRPISAARGGL